MGRKTRARPESDAEPDEQLGNSPRSSSWTDTLITKMWPWFLQYIWPLIREFVRRMVDELLEQLAARIKSWCTVNAKRREDEIIARARVAECSAERAIDAADREKHEAIARVWREVAELFRQQNEELMAKVDALSTDVKADASLQVAESEPALRRHEPGVQLLIGGVGSNLPHAEQSQLGYPEDHIVALKPGGFHELETIVDAKAKDRIE